ncbi:MAG: hypothetical protein K6E50_04235 [Lachnospiraceae bacterium]|nr:hypothetical protein [Lachnospiraceae bacterium]
MKKYHLTKEEKHDYGSFSQKLQRKLSGVLFRLCGGREKAYPFYRSWKHRNRTIRNKTEGWKHYMTEEPAYLAGFGHGLGAWRTGLVHAKLFGLEYAYTPMVSTAWEETLGLGDGMVRAAELLSKGFRKVVLPYYDTAREADLAMIRQIIRSYEGENVLFYNEYEQWTKKGDDIAGDEMIRDLFWKSSRRKAEKLTFAADWLSIALHIRRGDVQSRLRQGDETMRSRWLDTDYYIRIASMLEREVFPEGGIRFYVFSEGKKEDFPEFDALSSPVEFCLDMPEQQCFLHMCHADLLVTAASSFSIVSGAINPHVKIVPDRKWLIFPDTEEWIVATEDGEIGASGRERLKEYFAARKA